MPRDRTRTTRDDRDAYDEEHDEQAYDDSTYDGAPDGPTATEAARTALRYVTELTGREPVGITALERADEGWRVGVEVVEEHRIPSSSDVLAIYQADLDVEGELRGYRRVQRYARGRGDGR
ncbi:gas vesicle protein [Plantactinospora siamensis]|uniref:Gas vesicle protein n=1 Tax=Plantactinospora siamensis TaxID=555372 RepID=A0ABV6NW07_9ACTN